METREVEIQISPKIIMDWPNEQKLSQLITNVEYVMLDDNYKTLHKPFYCKDYFNEIILTEFDSKSREVYGFKSEKFPFNILETTTFKLGLLLENNINKSKYIQGLKYMLNQIDSNRNYLETNIEDTDLENEIILNIDTKYLHTPALFGFYNLMIRLAYNYNNEDYEDYIRNIYPKIESTDKIYSSDAMGFKGKENIMIYLFNGGELLQSIEEYKKEENNYNIHNNLGFISYFNIKYKNNLDKLIEDVKKNKKIDDVSSINII